MAARTARVINVQLVRGDDDSVGSESANGKTKNYIVGIDNNGVVVTTGSDTLNCDLGAAITGNNREGKTVTVRSVGIAKPLYDSKNSVATAATTSLSGNTVTCTLVNATDWTTGATLAANAICDRPLQLFVTVNEA